MTTIKFALVLGIVGTILIFFTEIGYTYRKMGLVKGGSVRLWLKAHIFMGIAGPLVVLWHANLSFYGFAGWLTWLTVIVVISGFVGRYIYRLIPRSIKGQELSLKELEAQATALASKLDELAAKSPEAAAALESARSQLGEAAAPRGGTPGLCGLIRSSIDWEIARLRIGRMLKGRADDGLLVEIRDLELAQATLQRRIGLLGASKATMSKWTIFHKPMTLILFVGILLHVASVFYYGKVLP